MHIAGVIDFDDRDDDLKLQRKTVKNDFILKKELNTWKSLTRSTPR